MSAFTEDMTAIAPRMGLETRYYPITDVNEASRVMQRLRDDGMDIAYVVETPILQGPHVAQMASAVAASGMPAIGGGTSYCLNGASILCVGSNPDEVLQKAARYVDRILKGTKPADLPVEQPTKVDVTLNRKAAAAAGIALPASLVQRADKVVD